MQYPHQKLRFIVAAILTAVLAAGYTCYDLYCLQDAYAISADDRTLVYVKDKDAAENVVKNVVSEYMPEDADVNKILTDKKLSVSSEKVRKIEHMICSEEKATELILEQNASTAPAFEVALQAEQTSTKPLERETKEIMDDELYEDTRVVQEEGEDGKVRITTSLNIVNGETVSETEANRDIIKKPKTQIVACGTKKLPALETNRFRDESWQVDGRIDAEGTKIAEYACKHVGMRYVWGGASLTSGADCSGFMMAVYRKFGYPMTRRGFTSMGTRVSTPQAGDIVYYPGHVAIYIGNGKVVHELNRSRGCVISSVNLCGRHSYWRVAKSPPKKKH